MTVKDIKNKILVIDDELGVRESMRHLFKNEYEVLLADSVDKGVDLLRREKPDAIIMDIRMPEKNGIEGLREIRAIDRQVAVVMLTGFGSLETAQEAIRFGANDYIKKPFEMHEMRRVVGQSIEQTAIARKRFSTASELQALNVQLQAELQSKEHLASLGQASSEFVHDLRNPLTAICGYVQLLIDDLAASGIKTGGESREAMEYLEIIGKNARRCQEMSQLWRTIGTRDPARVVPCRVDGLIADVTENAKPAADKAGVLIDVSPGPSDCLIMADHIQVFRALQNLVGNGIEAMERPGGRISLAWDVDADYVEIRVKDTGRGIPHDHLARVFDANFSTRKREGGMGLGLFITRKVIEAHGGTITLTNRPEGGAMALVRLPLASAKAALK